MNRLRTVSTRRLLATLSLIVVGLLSVTAIAIAGSAGPVPVSASLPQAIHDVLSAQAPSGVSAQVTFTDNLLSGANLDGYTSPLITGGTGRLWADGQHLRLELQSQSGDSELVVNGRSFWLSDPSSNTVYRGTLPAQHHSSYDAKDSVPTLAQIKAQLGKLAPHAKVSDPAPTDVGGQPAYAMTVTPTSKQGLLGSVALAFDPNTGIPLNLAVYARGDSTPQLQLSADNVSYGAVDPSVFAISPTAGAKVVHVDMPSSEKSTGSKAKKHAGKNTQVFGSGLGSILVLKHRADGSAENRTIATELGTLIELTRGGSSYLIVGSVKPAAAEAIAHRL